MIKKIIIGTIIAAVLSLTSFGLIYAYQKERPEKELTGSSARTATASGSQEYGASLSNGEGGKARLRGPGKDNCSGSTEMCGKSLQNCEQSQYQSSCDDCEHLQSRERLMEQLYNKDLDEEKHQQRYGENCMTVDPEKYQYRNTYQNQCQQDSSQCLEKQIRNNNNDNNR